MTRDTRESLIVAVALAAVVAVVLPLQTFLRNAEIYPFSLVRLLPELLALAVVSTGVFYLLARYVRLGAVLTALTVCVYLEAGLLSMGLPELNGGTVRELSNLARAIVDAGIWCGILVLLTVCARWMGAMRVWISLIVLVLSLASLVDVFVAKPTGVAPSPEDSPSAGGYANQQTVVANVRYSPGRNILVFILDSVPALAASDVLRTNAQLQAAFPGFTAYPQNVGMHECTKRGVPGLLTGRHYDPSEMPEAEYPLTMYGTNSFVTAAASAGWAVSFSPDLMPYGYTNLPIEQREERVQRRRSRDALAILRQSREVPYLSLSDVVAFRLSPFAAKAKILYSRSRHAVSGRHGQDEFWQERTQYARLAERPVGMDARPFLGVFHTWGVHPPWSGSLSDVLVEKFSSLAKLMEAYRASGLYDRSLIIVTADHGLDLVAAPDGYPSPASALLWVKPEGAQGIWRESEATTTHAGIAPLVRAALAAPVTDAEAWLTGERRLYRAQVYDGSKWVFRDWGRE